MAIADQMIDQAYSDLKATCGGVRNDYFALIYLEREFQVERDDAVAYVAFGGNDYGIDGFHFDEAKRNLCLLFIHPRAPNLISLRSAGTMPA